MEPVKEWRQKLKSRMARLFNNKCNICGYDKCLDALEFHHLNPETKKFTISQMRTNRQSWENIVEELKKCIMICANCYREVHAGLLRLEDREYINLEYTNYKLLEGTNKYCICGKIIVSSKKYCSAACSSKTRQKVSWDSQNTKDLVLELKNKGYTFVAIAEQFQVSDKTVAKWYYRYSSGVA